MSVRIDLNSDLGESFGAWHMGDDAAMLNIVTSANVACGFHAGDPAGILDTLREAASKGVAVGAHVGYPDLVGFGRRNMAPSSRELIADVVYQIGALKGLAAAAGTRVSYVKPHGALYNTIAFDQRQATDVITAIRAIDADLILVGLAGSRVLELAREQGLRTVAEAFADRAYQADGQLVSRRTPGAVIHDPTEVAERMLQLVERGSVPSIDGSNVRLEANSICVHGDSPGAVEIARAVRNTLESAGVEIQPFSSAVSSSASAALTATVSTAAASAVAGDGS
ncbi:LamB/YcsF family protein [Halomonas binhaiensis]|uniref:LamB/YcsF family protein n=1 Tax=Halomonas binhaiensis TaxID=2562282 RepID=UPI0011F05C74|nr:5-oxoprolinase subunit PxpA [Halomonas binhaiensis]